MVPEKYIERLTELSEKKLKLLRDMLDLTQMQAEAITDEGMEKLDKLIADKQGIIDEINKIDEEFTVYFQRLKQVLGIKSLSELKNPDIAGIKELQQCISEVMQVIDEMSALERENSVKAKTLLNTFGQEVKKLNQGKIITSAYRQSPVIQAPSYFIDKKK